MRQPWRSACLLGACSAVHSLVDALSVAGAGCRQPNWPSPRCMGNDTWLGGSDVRSGLAQFPAISFQSRMLISSTPREHFPTRGHRSSPWRPAACYSPAGLPHQHPSRRRVAFSLKGPTPNQLPASSPAAAQLLPTAAQGTLHHPLLRPTLLITQRDGSPALPPAAMANAAATPPRPGPPLPAPQPEAAEVRACPSSPLFHALTQLQARPGAAA